MQLFTQNVRRMTIDYHNVTRDLKNAYLLCNHIPTLKNIKRLNPCSMSREFHFSKRRRYWHTKVFKEGVAVRVLFFSKCVADTKKKKSKSQNWRLIFSFFYNSTFYIKQSRILSVCTNAIRPRAKFFENDYAYKCGKISSLLKRPESSLL